MSKPVLTDFATILDKANMEPLFDLAWGALKVPNLDAVAKTPAEAREALAIYSSDEVDALLTALGAAASYATATATDGQEIWQLPKSPTLELSVQVNGSTLTQALDYTLAEDTVIFTVPLDEGDSLRAQYR
jgi:hypothetical protein